MTVARARRREPGDETRLGPPRLENGDTLTRTEFERRYAAMPWIKKAELVEGEVHMPSPVKRSHGASHAHLVGWLTVYCAATPGIELCDNTTVRLDLDNEFQPDALLRLEPAAGGRSRASPEDYVEGPPELVVEVASSSASIDLHAKKQVYRRNGVQEYLVWQIYERQLVWFELKAGEYSPVTPDEQGVLRSRAFPGLWLDGPAMLAGDLTAVLACLQRGLASPEHAQFVQDLKARLTAAGRM